MKTVRPVHAIAGLIAGLAATAAAAAGQPERWQLNMTQGVTDTAQRAYDMHMWMLWICVAIGLVVFGAMAYAIFKFRKSKGAVPDKTFVHSTKLEILWTAVPTLILVVMAVPATVKVIEAYDTQGHEMTVKIVGQQWLWTYEYVGEGVTLTSRLDRESERIRQSGRVPTAAEHGTYLIDVDRPLVLPTDTKIRFILTADDVIHAWWVPALGWKQRRDPRLHQRSVDEHPRTGRLPWPMRRIVRQGSRLHADRGARGAARRVRAGTGEDGWRAAGHGCHRPGPHGAGACVRPLIEIRAHR